MHIIAVTNKLSHVDNQACQAVKKLKDNIQQKNAYVTHNNTPNYILYCLAGVGIK